MRERPIRVQMSCKKGYKMPPNTVSVAQPSKWGNPFLVGESGTPSECVAKYARYLRDVARFPLDRWNRDQLNESLVELRGKNLACWCKVTDPCHADVLLELANTTRSTS